MKKLSKYALKQLSEDERYEYEMKLWAYEHEFIEVDGCGEIVLSSDGGVIYFTVYDNEGDRLHDAYAEYIEDADNILWECKQILYEHGENYD